MIVSFGPKIALTLEMSWPGLTPALGGFLFINLAPVGFRNPNLVQSSELSVHCTLFAVFHSSYIVLFMVCVFVF